VNAVDVLPGDLDVALQASLDEAATRTAGENGQVAEAVLRSRSSLSKQVVLLEFSRNPEWYHSTLRECPELQACRDALAAQGFTFELPSKARVFVPPEMFEAVMEATRIHLGCDLLPRHVLVTTDLEETVLAVLKQPGNPEKVRCKGRGTLPLGSAAACIQHQLDIDVKRTFIDVPWKNSLRSEAHSGAVTASTTDAHTRSGRNPRAA